LKEKGRGMTEDRGKGKKTGKEEREEVRDRWNRRKR